MSGGNLATFHLKALDRVRSLAACIFGGIGRSASSTPDAYLLLAPDGTFGTPRYPSPNIQTPSVVLPVRACPLYKRHFEMKMERCLRGRAVAVIPAWRRDLGAGGWGRRELLPLSGGTSGQAYPSSHRYGRGAGGGGDLGGRCLSRHPGVGVGFGATGSHDSLDLG